VARTYGERQGELQERVSKIDKDVTEHTVMFSFAHRRLDELMGQAATELLGGEATTKVTNRQDRAIVILQSILKSLEEAQNKDDEFRQQQQNGNGDQQRQQGEMPLVPPRAEVELLKLMQQEAADLTRDADESHEAGQVDAAGKLQNDLSEQADALIKKLMERKRPGQPTPRPSGEEAPKDDNKPDEGDKPADGDKPAGEGAGG
jgi:hypothetical protein